ncbi:MAG: UDP-N-acetylmuramate dehydrogenase [Bdellovibrionales bacterium]|nr:UDP-N-acetylmuramate dehydrogenase [Bdellovibrionales bacterium]
MEIKKNVSLAEYTSWMVGGPAEYFCLPETEADVREALLWAHNNNQPVTLFGGGTNVLISDKGIRGLVMCLRRFSGVESKEVNGRLEITAMAGTAKSELLKVFLKNKLAPALFLAGLPGDVGGGVVMNAGVAEGFVPREFVEITDWVEVLRLKDGQFITQRFTKDQIHWEYRHSKGWQPGVITRVGLSWPMQPDATILDQVKSANKTRLSKQPLDMPSCGSVFRNPTGHKAAQLIDGCGLKGYTVGGAQVSLKHANFIVNLGEAKAMDMWHIIEHVRSTVKSLKSVELQTEVVRLGEWN